MTTLADRLSAVCAELERNGWPVDPIPDDAPDTVLLSRLLQEERRLRVMAEAP